jgi:hypothetical protein
MENCPKCDLFMQNVMHLQNEQKKLQRDYNFISDSCYRLLEELSHFIKDSNGHIIPERRHIAAQVVSAVRHGVIKGEGLKSKQE